MDKQQKSHGTGVIKKQKTSIKQAEVAKSSENYKENEC